MGGKNSGHILCSDTDWDRVFEAIEYLRNVGETYRGIADLTGLGNETISAWHRRKLRPREYYVRWFFAALDRNNVRYKAGQNV